MQILTMTSGFKLHYRSGVEIWEYGVLRCWHFSAFLASAASIFLLQQSILPDTIWLLGDQSVETTESLWRDMTNYRVPGLSHGVVCVILCLAVWVPACQTDGQSDGRMDRQTHDDSIYRGSTESRDKIRQ